MTDARPDPWTIHGSEEGPNLIIARARFDDAENPRTGERMRRVVLETPSWCNVVALTPENRLVVVRQFRFGTAEVTTEIPGGVVDRGEDPAATAVRELREETGYTAADWSPLGAVEPNPAFQTNLCFHFLARGATKTHETELDPGEDIVVDTLSLEEAHGMVASGAIRHSLVVCALARVMDLRG